MNNSNSHHPVSFVGADRVRVPDMVRPPLGVVVAEREALVPYAERQLEGDEGLQRRRRDGRDAVLQLNQCRGCSRRHANRGQA